MGCVPWPSSYPCHACGVTGGVHPRATAPTHQAATTCQPPSSHPWQLPRHHQPHPVPHWPQHGVHQLGQHQHVIIRLHLNHGQVHPQTNQPATAQVSPSIRNWPACQDQPGLNISMGLDLRGRAAGPCCCRRLTTRAAPATSRVTAPGVCRAASTWPAHSRAHTQPHWRAAAPGRARHPPPTIHQPLLLLLRSAAPAAAAPPTHTWAAGGNTPPGVPSPPRTAAASAPSGGAVSWTAAAHSVHHQSGASPGVVHALPNTQRHLVFHAHQPAPPWVTTAAHQHQMPSTPDPVIQTISRHHRLLGGGQGTITSATPPPPMSSASCTPAATPLTAHAARTRATHRLARHPAPFPHPRSARQGAAAPPLSSPNRAAPPPHPGARAAMQLARAPHSSAKSFTVLHGAHHQQDAHKHTGQSISTPTPYAIFFLFFFSSTSAPPCPRTSIPIMAVINGAPWPATPPASSAGLQDKQPARASISWRRHHPPAPNGCSCLAHRKGRASPVRWSASPRTGWKSGHGAVAPPPTTTSPASLHHHSSSHHHEERGVPPSPPPTARARPGSTCVCMSRCCGPRAPTHRQNRAPRQQRHRLHHGQCDVSLSHVSLPHPH